MARNVLATFKVMPESVEVDLNSVALKIREIDLGEIKDIDQNEIAFGLKEIVVLFLIPDEGGLVERIEDELRAIEGVNSAENTNITLV